MKLITIASLIVLFSTVPFGKTQRRCFNPNRRSGECKSILDCPTLMSIVIQQPIPEDDQRFLVESQCDDGPGEPPYVCCNDDVGFLSGLITNSILTQSDGQGDVIPSPPTCGSRDVGNEIYEKPLLNEGMFPWLALLTYVTDDGKISINCGGSLINTRYVLTAAHCVKGTIENDIGPLFEVRLGVFDLTTDSANCTGTYCNILQVGIEEVIPHELYISNSTNRYHDIALIRLSRDVVYTDSIRPICLPATLSFGSSTPKTELTIAGWGVSPRGNISDFQQILTVPVLDQKDCSSKLALEDVTVIASQVCAGGRDSDDSCNGDSGGPLMTFIHNFWVVEGINSFNDYCGAFGLWPGTYTRVSAYGNWIRRHMRP